MSVSEKEFLEARELILLAFAEPDTMTGPIEYRGCEVSRDNQGWIVSRGGETIETIPNEAFVEASHFLKHIDTAIQSGSRVARKTWLKVMA